MDIPSLSIAMSQADLMTQVGVAMLGNSLDLSESVGDSLVSMIDKSAMEQSVTPNIGANFDVSV